MTEQRFLYRCGTCTHWTEHTGWHDPIRTYIEPWSLEVEDEDKALQHAVNVAREWRVCKGVEENTEIVVPRGTDPATVEVPLAVTVDASNYQADLFTQAEFGCVLWKASSAP